VGNATISASLSGTTGMATLSVTAATLVSVAVTPATPSIARGTTIPRLARLLIEIIVKDDLFNAIVDPPPPSRRETATKPDPKWAAALRV